MKKYSFLVLLLAIVLLTGCGSKEKKMICKLSSDNGSYSLKTTYEIYHDGENVSHVDIVETFTSSDSTILDQMESYMNQMYQNLSDTYGGYTFKITKNSGEVVSNVTTDYTKLNLDKLLEDDNSAKTFVKEGKVKLEGLKETYKSINVKCED